jgi:lipoprotein-releasing system permease protein
MRLSPFIARRYLFAKSSTNAVNIITLISICSLIIGTIVFLVVLSAFSGLKQFNLSVISAIDPDLKVMPGQGKTIRITKDQEKAIQALSGVAHFSKIIEERVYLEYDGKTHLGYLKGVDKNFLNVNRIDTTVFAGTWHSQTEPEVVIGAGIRRRLSLALSDYGSLLQVMVPKPGKGQITDPSQAFRKSGAIASGIFYTGQSIDNDHLFTHIDYAGKLLNYELDEVSALEIKLDAIEDEKNVQQELQNILENKVIIKNRIALNDSLYKMLNTENLALYFICALVIIIVLFCFVGSIIMIIIDKRPHIKTLSDLGTPLKEIRHTFFLQGLYMVVLGTICGIIIGTIIVLLQQFTGLIKITQNLAYPVHLTFGNVCIVLATILLLGVAAAKLASTRINAKLIRD